MSNAPAMQHQGALSGCFPRRVRTAYYTLLAFLSLGGVSALAYRLIYGLKVTALTSPIPWGLWVAIYIYFSGLSAGCFLLSTLIYVFGWRRYEKVGRLALLAALFALVGAMVFIWIDLGHPWRFWYVFTRWNPTSVLAWEILFYVFYAFAMLCALWLLMRCDLANRALRESGWRRIFYRVLALGFRCPETASEWLRCHGQSMRVLKILGILGIPVGLVVPGGSGALFGVVAAKPYWYTAIFPVIFVVSALASGAALLTFLYAFFGRRDDEYPHLVKGLANLMVLFLSTDLFLLGAELLVGLYGRIPEHVEVYHQILFGPFPYVFWVGQLLLGAIIPIFLASWSRTRQDPFWLGVAGLSAAVGLVGVRLNLVIPALVIPVLKGLDTAISDPRWSYHYFPSFSEWATTIGLIALVAWGFSVAVRILPVFGEVEEQFRKGDVRGV
jgi:Ni/Fe-hydrogenase subunit HybB-like protein